MNSNLPKHVEDLYIQLDDFESYVEAFFDWLDGKGRRGPDCAPPDFESEMTNEQTEAFDLMLAHIERELRYLKATWDNHKHETRR